MFCLTTQARVDPSTPTEKPSARLPSESHNSAITGPYAQFSKMDSDEIYTAAVKDLQEIFSVKVSNVAM